MDGAVTVLIGVHVPEAFLIVDERRGSCKDPYAVRSKLGWTIISKRCRNDSAKKVNVNFINTAADHLLEQQIECPWTVDNVEVGHPDARQLTPGILRPKAVNFRAPHFFLFFPLSAFFLQASNNTRLFDVALHFPLILSTFIFKR